MKFLSSHEHFERLRLSHEPWQTLRSAPSCNQAECRAAVSEDGMRVSDAHIASESQVQSSSHAVTAHSSNYERREAIDGEHQPLSHQRKVEGICTEVSDLVQVGAGGEKFVIAGDDESLGIAREFLDLGTQRFNTGSREPVRAITGDEAQQCCALTIFYFKKLRDLCASVSLW